MDGLHQLEMVILLLAVVLLLTTVAQKLVVPYPILLVIGGLILGLIPGLPTVTLSPDLVFLVFLPPILWAAAYFTSWREFRGESSPDFMAGGRPRVGHDGGGCGGRARGAAGISDGRSHCLGAIVSPPDAVSATAIGKRLRIPRRVVTILEGGKSGKRCDWRWCCIARPSGPRSAGVSYWVTRFCRLCWPPSWACDRDRRRHSVALGALRGVDSFTEIAITLLAPYIAWVLGEVTHASAVLACVAGGLHVRQHFSAAVAPVTRLQARAVWDLLIFVLNGFIFILIGLQLGALRTAIPADRFGAASMAGAAVSLTAIVVRLAWVPAAAALPRLMSATLRARDPMPPRAHIFVVAWTGMRGIVTLAAALASAGVDGCRHAVPVSRRDHLNQFFRDSRHPRAAGAFTHANHPGTLHLEEDRGLLEREESSHANRRPRRH